MASLVQALIVKYERTPPDENLCQVCAKLTREIGPTCKEEALCTLESEARYLLGAHCPLCRLLKNSYEGS